jgi:hypothetical protein
MLGRYCHLYRSTRVVLDHLRSRIVPGTAIVLDEFWIVTDQKRRAFNEWLSITGRNSRHERALSSSFAW